MVALLGMVALNLAGCASMSEQQCRQAQWQNVGLKDGREGATSSRLDAHREACAKVGVVPDAQVWQSGYEQGLQSYCSPNSAWYAGLANSTYYGVCAPYDEATFLRYHRAGRLVWQARQDLSRNRSQMTRLEEGLKKATKDDERRRLQDELGRAERERNRLTALLVTLELAGPPR